VPPIEFTGNYQDLSTATGFQFKFFCERCQNGYMSSFERYELGMAENLFRGASQLFGGLFQHGATAAETLQNLVGGPRHDAALRRAVEEIKPLFKQCPHCGDWMCEKVCWNAEAGLCKRCAPVAREVETRARAQHVETQVTNDLFLEENKRMSAKGKEVNKNCPNCGAETLGKKFCPECGQPTGLGTRFCPECGARTTPGAKFCPECGQKLSPGGAS
jgi:ribosomal protein L32